MDTLLTDDDKDKIYEVILNQYITCIKNNEITQEKREDISTALLNGVDNTTSWSELFNFFNSFISQYPFFKPVLLHIKDTKSKIQESQVIEKLQQYVKSLI